MCDPVTATFITLGVSTATSVGMGISNAYNASAQAQASLNAQAQAQQASIQVSNAQSSQQMAMQQQQLQMQQNQFLANQRLSMQQQASNQALQRQQQFQQQELSIRQMKSQQLQQRQMMAESRNLQMQQANTDILNRYNQARDAVINERGQIMTKNEVDRKIYESDKFTAKLQKDENLSAANRVYIAEQQKLSEKRKEAAFEAQGIMAKSIGAKGTILASGRVGQSIGLLINDVDRQAGFELAQERAMLEAAEVSAIIGMDQAYQQNRAADMKADSSVGFAPEMPYLPKLPEVPNFVSLGIPK